MEKMMTPIKISNSVTEMDEVELLNKLNYLSYTFCVNADFSKTDAINRLVNDLEMNAMEGILRVLEDDLGYRPYQNKIYELVEDIFEDQDSYNINRMMSSIRRSKMIPIDGDNEKYMKWMKNRVKYGVKSLMEHLEEIEIKSYH